MVWPVRVRQADLARAGTLQRALRRLQKSEGGQILHSQQEAADVVIIVASHQLAEGSLFLVLISGSV